MENRFKPIYLLPVCRDMTLLRVVSPNRSRRQKGLGGRDEQEIRLIRKANTM